MPEYEFAALIQRFCYYVSSGSPPVFCRLSPSKNRGGVPTRTTPTHQPRCAAAAGLAPTALPRTARIVGVINAAFRSPTASRRRRFIFAAAFAVWCFPAGPGLTPRRSPRTLHLFTSAGGVVLRCWSSAVATGIPLDTRNRMPSGVAAVSCCQTLPRATIRQVLLASGDVLQTANQKPPQKPPLPCTVGFAKA